MTISEQRAFLIVGAGAIGGVVAAHLSDAGYNVTVVDTNADHIAAIKQNGLVISGAADVRSRPNAVTPDQLTGTFDTILICVKTGNSEAAISLALPHIAAGGTAVALQNGLAYLPVQAAFGDKATLAATISVGATYERPGQVTMTGPGSLHIGELDGSMTPRLQSLVAAMENVCAAQSSSNVLGHIWSKISLIAVYVATAIADENVLDLYHNDKDRGLFTEIVRETARLGQAEGVHLEEVDGFSLEAFLANGSDAAIEQAWQAQIHAWNNYTQRRSGIWRDLAVHKRKTESRPVLLPLVDIGRRHGLATHYLEAIIALVDKVESEGAERGPHHLDALRAAGLAASAANKTDAAT